MGQGLGSGPSIRVKSLVCAGEDGDVTSGRLDLERAAVSLAHSAYKCKHPAHRYFTSHKAVVFLGSVCNAARPVQARLPEREDLILLGRA